MSKAISGAVEIAAGAVLVATGVGAGFGASLIMAGVGTELGAIASMLNPNQGMPVTVRQPAAPRQIIYGTQRVGAVEVFESTTGSSKDQYNMVLVFSGHEITAIENLYLDGRQVYWAGSGDGYVVRNGYGFGGGADGQTHIGPDGSHYVFANASSGHEGVWATARFGDQAEGDVMGELTANDSRWAADSKGNSPWLGGCAYIYLKCEYDTNVFPNKPDAKATIKGKPVYDPRTGQTAYSSNWALIAADLIRDTEHGLGDPSINEEQLIAAANICDEQVSCAAGMESRYTAHLHFTSDQSVGEVLQTLMQAAGGRISYVGGEWHIYPATYTGPSASFGPDALVDKPSWSAQRPFREKVNRVQGTFIAPNVPYSVAGDLYDSNGWFNGTIENNFPFGFAPTNYPTYACDTLHGYASDQYLNEDGGTVLPLNLDLSAVLSVSQAQRLAKIALLRNRQQGAGTLIMGPEAYQLQPNDTFYMTFPQRGWENKLLEVNTVQFVVDKDANGLPLIKVVVGVNETAASVYEDMQPGEELTVYDVPAAPQLGTYTTEPPTNIILISGASSALVAADGTVTPRIQVEWDTPHDVRVAHIQTQYRLTGASTWIDGGTVGADSNLMFIGPIIAGQNYDVQIRSLQANGAASVWVPLSGFTTSVVLSVSSQDAIGPGSLIGEGYTDGTAGIECTTFTAQLGGKSVTYFPDVQTITGLAQQTLYYVYVVDPNLTAGDLTPVATTNKADYVGKLGYFLVDQIVTPYAAASSGGTSTTSGQRYYPSTYQDVGTRTTSMPDAAYDGDLTSYASISGSSSSVSNTQGDCIYQGDPSIAIGYATTLNVVAEVIITGGGGSAQVTVSGIPGANLVLDAGASTTQQTYTVTVPANTPLSGISIEAVATPSGSVRSNVTIRIYEIYVQA